MNVAKRTKHCREPRFTTRLPGPRSVAKLALCATALFCFPGICSAQLKVIVSGGFSSAYRQLLPEFGRESGIHVTTASGASQGSGPQTIATMLAKGEQADVVILSREGLAELAAAGRVIAGSDVDLAQAPLAMGVRAGAKPPDIGTVDALKRALLQAK